MPPASDPAHTAPASPATASRAAASVALPSLSERDAELVREAARALPQRAAQVLAGGGHRALGRVVRDSVLLLLPGHPAHEVPTDDLLDAASGAIGRLAALQNPSGTFRGGDNVDSPPDTAFTVNDLAWAQVAMLRAADRSTAADSPSEVPAGGPIDTTAPLGRLRDSLDRVLTTVTPALVNGGVHTPNHRWEIASALARLWEAQADESTRGRARQWLAEGVDLQADGMFSERSANYAAHVSLPALLTLGRILERPDLLAAADRATRTQAELTDDRGLVETLASRRQDQFAPFDGGALHPWFRAHAARTGDPISARAAQRTAGRVTADDLLTLLALAAEDPLALGDLPTPSPMPTPSSPEVVELADSGLVRVDYGSSVTVLFGGTDTAAIGRVTSGASSQPVLARFRGTELGVRELRLSRDFFSVGPLRPGRPRRLPGSGSSPGSLRYTLDEHVEAEYFQPLDPSDLAPDGLYELEFNGRFAAAMAFSRRRAETVSLATSMQAAVAPGELDLRWEFEGPETPLCLLLALDGGHLDPDLGVGERGRRVLEPVGSSSEARCTVVGHGERLEITAAGALGGPAFYGPGEAYTFLGASDEPGGDALLIPASSAASLTLRLRVGPRLAD